MTNPDPEATQFPQILKYNIRLHYVSNSNQEIKTKDHSLQNPFFIHILSPQITVANLPVRAPALEPVPHTAPGAHPVLPKAGSTLPELLLQHQLWALLFLHYQQLPVAWGVVEYAAIWRDFLIHA